MSCQCSIVKANLSRLGRFTHCAFVHGREVQERWAWARTIQTARRLLAEYEAGQPSRKTCLVLTLSARKLTSLLIACLALQTMCSCKIEIAFQHLRVISMIPGDHAFWLLKHLSLSSEGFVMLFSRLQSSLLDKLRSKIAVTVWGIITNPKCTAPTWMTWIYDALVGGPSSPYPILLYIER